MLAAARPRRRGRGPGDREGTKVHFDLSTNTIISSVPRTEDSGKKKPVCALSPGLLTQGQTHRAQQYQVYKIQA